MAFPHLVSQPVAQGVRVLDADPDLGANLTRERFEQARQALVARVETVPRGAWTPDAEGRPGRQRRHRPARPRGRARPPALAAATARAPSCSDRVTCCARARTASASCSRPSRVAFRVDRAAVLAHLDVRFVARSARFPEMTGELISRALDRSRLLARMLAVAQLPRVDTRLLIAMWHLSERWGTVRPEGRVLPSFLSHELLGWIVGARRPSVTTALGQLSQRGLVMRQDDGTWLLGDEPPVFDGLAVAS